MRELRHPWMWLSLSWLGIALLIYLSLTAITVKVDIEHGDKLAHLLGYALLMGWFVQIYRSRTAIILHAVGLIVLGGVLEFLQPMNGRYFEYQDMMANSLGVLAALAIAPTPLSLLLLKFERRLGL